MAKKIYIITGYMNDFNAGDDPESLCQIIDECFFSHEKAQARCDELNEDARAYPNGVDDDDDCDYDGDDDGCMQYEVREIKICDAVRDAMIPYRRINYHRLEIRYSRTYGEFKASHSQYDRQRVNRRYRRLSKSLIEEECTSDELEDDPVRQPELV